MLTPQTLPCTPRFGHSESHHHGSVTVMIRKVAAAGDVACASLRPRERSTLPPPAHPLVHAIVAPPKAVVPHSHDSLAGGSSGPPGATDGRVLSCGGGTSSGRGGSSGLSCDPDAGTLVKIFRQPLPAGNRPLRGRGGWAAWRTSRVPGRLGGAGHGGAEGHSGGAPAGAPEQLSSGGAPPHPWARRRSTDDGRVRR